MTLSIIVLKGKITRCASIPNDCNSLCTTSDHDCLAGFEFGTISQIVKIVELACAGLVYPSDANDRRTKLRATVTSRSLRNFIFIFTGFLESNNADKEYARTAEPI